MTRRLARTFVVVLVGLLAALLPGTGSPAVAQRDCPHALTPPPPVDKSEEPLPGKASPVPLPVPDEPVGGERMAECGPVLPDGAKPLPRGLTAASWVLADLDSGEVLAAMDPHGRQRPASVIKVLTAMVALRELALDEVIVGTKTDANQEGSRVGIGPKGKYTVKQLLEGLLMRSGNDIAHALAMRLGGLDATVDAMNELARSAGALDTRASTPSGLDGPGTSTSAYDMALLFRLAMQDERFAAMVATRQIDFPGFDDKPGFIVSNDNKLLANYPGALGGKTGFTDDARHTYIGAAERDGRRLTVVLLRGEHKPVLMWEQAAALLDYGFALPAGDAALGQLVERSPAPAPASTTGPNPTGLGDAEAVTGASGTGSARPELLYIGALALVSVALIGVLWWRRRRAHHAAFDIGVQ